jgi:acetyl esterase/lipase
VQSLPVTAAEGHSVIALLRNPPGTAPRPVVVLLHGGLEPRPESELRDSLLKGPTPLRFLAAGYAVVAPTYRSRSHDPQSSDALQDCLAVVDAIRKRPEIDARSVAVYGCSGGGSLALELAGERPLAAIAAEEPASILFAGMFTRDTPKSGAAFRASDSQAIMEDPRRFYTEPVQRFTREKIRRISCPVLILHGDVHAINRINREIILPELKAAGKHVEDILYPGEPHCFGFRGDRRPEAASKLFADCDRFFRRHLRTPPRALPAALVRMVPQE